MLKHCVFIRFRPEVSQKERIELYQGLQSLESQLSGWRGFLAGANITPEVGMDKGYNGGFMIDFVDEAARDAYLQNPEHQQLGQRLVAAAVDGIAGIMVFDLFY
ncbi:Dabb family protein [uncultured Thiothrix sp.]|uniref:Dabb family protein n=1 Tax=uncultured Thiothrix sp. TaxID=223185 RepID=UPI00262E7F42|nr:Dabb family protein [uncultured Thiothrix sp.]